jgi:hypothetical protein|nr:MAG TPA: Protein of unknown function (DUF1804) [Caudoviricetes sp.]
MEKKTERRDWGEIKNAYITGKESLKELAEKYGIPLRTIKDRSSKERWVEERKKFRTDVAQKASQKTAKKEVKRLVKLRDVAEDVADLIGQDVERMKKLREKRKNVTPEDVKMIKDLTVALKNIADVMRDVYDIPTIREKLLQAKYNDYKRILAEMEKAPEDSLIVLAETLERVEEDDMEEMDKDGGGAAEGEEGNLEPTAEAD